MLAPYQTAFQRVTNIYPFNYLAPKSAFNFFAYLGYPNAYLSSMVQPYLNACPDYKTQFTNGKMVCSNGNRFGSVCTHYCYLGYELHGELCYNTQGMCSITCEAATGMWFPAQPACHDINECAVNHGSCANDAVCVNTEGSFYCKCKSGWTGFFCDIDIDECAVNDVNGNAGGCLNGANCVNQQGSYICECTTGFTGHQCELNKQTCVSSGVTVDLDMLLILDSSSSVGYAGFKKQVEIAVDIVRSFNTKPTPASTGSRIGFFHFNDVSNLNEVYLNQTYSTVQLEIALEALDYSNYNYTDTGSVTASALYNAASLSLSQLSGNRGTNSDVVVVITDGQTTESLTAINDAATQIQNTGAAVFVVGVDLALRQGAMQVVNAIAQDVYSAVYYFGYPGYSQMGHYGYSGYTDYAVGYNAYSSHSAYRDTLFQTASDLVTLIHNNFCDGGLQCFVTDSYIPNGAVSCSNGVALGSQCTYECVPGYTNFQSLTVGTNTATCVDDGNTLTATLAKPCCVNATALSLSPICTITTDASGTSWVAGGGMPPMDIVFVLDATPSGGTSTNTWLSIINVVKALVGGLDISYTAARVGAFRYGVGVEAYSEIKLRDTTNITNFYTALDALPSGLPAGNSVTYTAENLGVALNHAVSRSLSRDYGGRDRHGVTDVVVVITDSISSDDVIIPAHILKAYNALVYGIGIDFDVNNPTASTTIAAITGHQETYVGYPAFEAAFTTSAVDTQNRLKRLVCDPCRQL